MYAKRANRAPSDRLHGQSVKIPVSVKIPIAVPNLNSSFTIHVRYIKQELSMPVWGWV